MDLAVLAVILASSSQAPSGAAVTIVIPWAKGSGSPPVAQRIDFDGCEESRLDK